MRFWVNLSAGEFLLSLLSEIPSCFPCSLMMMIDFSVPEGECLNSLINLCVTASGN